MVNGYLKVCLALALLTCVPGGAVDYHDTLDDYHDFEAVTSDKQLLRQHLNCYVDKGPCTELMQSYKKHIATFVMEGCARCSGPQKRMLRQWLEGLEKTDPQGYEEYKKKYDPDNVYMKPLIAAVVGY